MGITQSTLFAINWKRMLGNNTYNMYGMPQKEIRGQPPAPMKPIYYINTPRKVSSKDMRRHHRIKQPGFDVQRKR
tara:strand:- start:266 stop:490 length:225 start_codon:yes stop_codon:yes gene_type:complete